MSTVTAIKCGKCKNTHTTVAEVRACYQPVPRGITADAKRVMGVSKIPEGRYAIDIDGTVKFYRVSVPTEGRWRGYTFVDVQASDEFHAIRNAETRKTILAAIAFQGQDVSMARYGQLLGYCGMCGRVLTDKLSRDRGIGPVCWEKI